MTKKKSCLVAMSGGIDSSVTAKLLQEEGYDCVGVMMRLLPADMEPISSFEAAAQDARRVARDLDIPFHILDLRADFKKEVIDPFILAYSQARTPNPCVNCNKFMKFGRLLAFADELGLDYLATGHYVRLAYREEYGRKVLIKGDDEKKDQSYFMYRLDQKQLSRCIFPLGDYDKDQVRVLAAHLGFDVKKKGESQEICFIPDDDYRAFLQDRRPGTLFPGDFIDLEGKVLGRHQGLSFYTIGQRKGLGIALGYPAYVVSMDVEANTITLGQADDLKGQAFKVTSLNFSAIDWPTDPLQTTVKVRYRSQAVGARVEVEARKENEEENRENKERKGRVYLDQPLSAITPGQSAVFYEGQVLLGGGIIEGLIEN